MEGLPVSFVVVASVVVVVVVVASVVVVVVASHSGRKMQKCDINSDSL